MKKITSIDIIRKTFETLKVERVEENPSVGMISIFYDDCISPIFLEKKQYNDLLEGHVVELHHGEVALVVED